MTQKVIKIGSSAGVTIPKKQLEELGLKIGDQVDLGDIKPAGKTLKDFSKELDNFMDTHEQDLQNLARR